MCGVREFLQFLRKLRVRDLLKLHWITENFYRILSYCGLDTAECDALFHQNIPNKHHSTIYFHVQNEESHLNIKDYQGNNVILRMDGGNSFQDILVIKGALCNSCKCEA